jgi:hypothetical protein
LHDRPQVIHTILYCQNYAKMGRFFQSMPFNQRSGHTPHLNKLAPDELTTDLRNSFLDEIADFAMCLYVIWL